MEAYEDNLDKINEHKKAVRETTKATRDVNYKDTNAKIRDYERESRRNVDYEPTIQRKLRISSSLHQLTPAVAIPLQSPTTDPVLPSRITSRRASQSEDPGGRIWNHLNRIWRRRKQRKQRQL